MNMRQRQYIRKRLSEVLHDKREAIQERFKKERSKKNMCPQKVLDMIHAGKADFVVPKKAPVKGYSCGPAFPEFFDCVRFKEPIETDEQRESRVRSEEREASAKLRAFYDSLTDQIELGEPKDGQQLIDKLQAYGA